MGAVVRVVAGELKSRRLVNPPPGVRPTADRVRESLFARLGDLSDARVLDLYAGTGALAIEALSRGAERAVFVECAPRALEVIRENLQRLELCARSRVLGGDASKWVGRLARAGDRFDLIFVDPPYASEEVGRAIAGIAESDLLELGGSLILETRKGQPVPTADRLRQVDQWLYGDTVVTRLEVCSQI